MDKQFNIDKMSRHTPYEVPENFHESLRAEVEQQLFGTAKPKSAPWRKALWPAMAAAASVAVFFFVKQTPTANDTATKQVMLNNICKAYDNLSVDDQNYYMELCFDNINNIDY